MKLYKFCFFFLLKIPSCGENISSDAFKNNVGTLIESNFVSKHASL